MLIRLNKRLFNLAIWPGANQQQWSAGKVRAGTHMGRCLCGPADNFTAQHLPLHFCFSNNTPTLPSQQHLDQSTTKISISYTIPSNILPQTIQYARNRESCPLHTALRVRSTRKKGTRFLQPHLPCNDINKMKNMLTTSFLLN
jgi:hypothetical protein